MLTDNQNDSYNLFYESTHNNEFLDKKTEILIGLSAAIAMNCQPCTNYYLSKAKKIKITKGEISEVIAKVMAVASGQKKLQTQEVLIEYKINLDEFKKKVLTSSSRGTPRTHTFFAKNAKKPPVLGAL